MKRPAKRPAAAVSPSEDESEEIDPISEEEEDDSPSADVRLDKWMWAARLFKTRSQAAESCDGGHVKVGGVNAKPARPVRIGDRIEARTPGGPRIVVVRALSNRRGPAEEAAKLFEDHSPPPPPKEPPAMRWERSEGRPTKKDRRKLDRFKGW